MSCTSFDAIQLAGFLEMACGDMIKRTLQKDEEVMVPMQEMLHVKSESEVLGLETNFTKESNNFDKYECIDKGHVYDPLPKLKNGNLFF